MLWFGIDSPPEERLATHDDALREWAYNVGAERRERAWLLSDYDVWVANPAYQGPPVPHPEDYFDFGDD